MYRIDLTGQKFGMLTAVEYVSGRVWLWRCDCGNTVELSCHNVKAGSTKSCGCLRSPRSAGTNGPVRLSPWNRLSWDGRPLVVHANALGLPPRDALEHLIERALGDATE